MNFGEALASLRTGGKLARAGWNGKGMFIYYVPAGDYEPTTEVGHEIATPGGLVPYGPYIAFKTAQGNVVPWVASHTDILSSDWEEVID